MKNFNNARLALTSALAVALASAASMAQAQAVSNPIVTLIESVDLSTVATAVAAVALLIVGIALTFKGPDVAKRVIRKV